MIRVRLLTKNLYEFSECAEVVSISDNTNTAAEILNGLNLSSKYQQIAIKTDVSTDESFFEKVCFTKMKVEKVFHIPKYPWIRLATQVFF